MTPIFDTSAGNPAVIGEPVEIAPGRGDLRFSSVPLSQYDPTDPLSTFQGWSGDPFVDGRPVSYARFYASQPWVAIAVMRMLTWATRVPLKVYRRIDDEGNRKRLGPEDHPLAAAVRAPWERGTMAELVQSLMGPLLVHGNSLMAVDQGAKNAIRFDELDWRAIKPIRLDDQDSWSPIAGWQIERPQARPETRSVDTTLHLRWWSPMGPLGISPLYQLRTTLAAEAAAVTWTLSNLKQSARPSGVVEMTDEALKLRPDDRRKLYEKGVDDFRENYGGPGKAGLLPVMSPGFKWTTTQHTTAVEAELQAQRMANRNEVASIYMIPPPMIGQLERSTFNNITTLRELAYTDGLAPPLVMIEQKLTATILRDLLGEDDTFVEFDLGLILRGDRLKEIQALREGISSALYTPNEGRRAINQPPSDAPGADDLWLQQNNLKPLGAPPEPPKPPPAPVAPPAEPVPAEPTPEEGQ